MSGNLAIFVINAIIAEGLAVFYAYFIGNMIDYLEDPDAPQDHAIFYALIFTSAQFFALLLRSFYIQRGFQLSIILRKVIVAALYQKTIGLSMKSMTETNSGKLISLINGDLFQAEIGLSFCPLIIAAPFINLIAYTFIATKLGVLSTLIPLVCWFILIFIQNCVSNITKATKMKEAQVNDERLKTVNDLVLGVRTIKCYGWETYYEDKAR